jgi:predicted nuclease of restriction endonuclease-like (RecB) superfamily
MTYDDNRLRWNGADLLTRVARNFLSKENKSIDQKELKVQPSYIFFPISSQNITRYSPNFEFISLHAYSFLAFR